MPPFVTIILPVRNESQFIIPCLQSIAAQDYPADRMELLIVDGLSNDDTLNIVNEFKIQNSKFSIQLLVNPNRTAPYAMNIGIKQAKGDVILRFDGHAIMAPDYVSNCVKYLEQTKAGNVGGPVQNITDGSMIGKAIEISHNSVYGLGGGAFRMGNYEGYTDTVTFGCFPKETFAKYGLYDTRLTRNQDIEFNSRIRRGIKLKSNFKFQISDSLACKAGCQSQNDVINSKTVNPHAEQPATKNCKLSPGKIYLTPKIKSYYYCRNTLKGLWDQNFKNGQWVVYTKYIAPYALSLRHFIPLAFVSTILLLACLAGLTGTTGLNGSKLNQVFILSTFSIQLTSLRLLLLLLLAYFGATLFFVGKAWRSLKLTGDRGQGTGDNTVYSRQETEDSMDTKYQILNTEYGLLPLLLLPIVFMTLHFSYGLGSIWGLVTLPFISSKF